MTVSSNSSLFWAHISSPNLEKVWEEAPLPPLEQLQSTPDLSGEMALFMPKISASPTEDSPKGADRVDQVAKGCFDACSESQKLLEQNMSPPMLGESFYEALSPLETMMPQPDLLMAQGIAYQLKLQGEKDSKKAVECFLQASGLERLEDLHQLGEVYLEGIGCEQDTALAFTIFSAGADLGDPVCRDFVQGIDLSSLPQMPVESSLSVQANGSPQTIPALSHIEVLNEGCIKSVVNEQEIVKSPPEVGERIKKANAGEALNKRGLNYYYGRNGKEQNFKKAFVLFVKAGMTGNARAKCNLGYCYVYGKGCKQRKRKGIRLLQEAADQGCPEAKTCLGIGWLFDWNEERVVHKDRHRYYKIAVKFFQQGASLDPVCRHNLATCYEFELGVLHNPKEGARLHALADTLSSSKVPGNLIEEISYRITPDDAQGILAASKKGQRYLLRKIRKVEENPSCTSLTSQVTQTIFPSQPLQPPDREYHPDNSISEGIAYQLGLKGEKDSVKAMMSFLLAGGLQNLEQLSQLGKRYLNGIGGERNPSIASLIFSVGADLGDPACRDWLKSSRCASSSLPSSSLTKDRVIAFEEVEYRLNDVLEEIAQQENLSPYVTRLVERSKKGDAEALNDLGLCYYEAREVAQRFDHAFTLFACAVKKGYPAALLNLGVCYQYGNGCKKKRNNAIKWFCQVSNARCILANNILGLWKLFSAEPKKLFHKESHTAHKEAFEYFRNGALKGDQTCMRNLASCLEIGVGVEPNLEMAQAIREKADLSPPNLEMSHVVREVFYEFTKEDVI